MSIIFNQDNATFPIGPYANSSLADELFDYHPHGGSNDERVEPRNLNQLVDAIIFIYKDYIRKYTEQMENFGVQSKKFKLYGKFFHHAAPWLAGTLSLSVIIAAFSIFSGISILAGATLASLAGGLYVYDWLEVKSQKWSQEGEECRIQSMRRQQQLEHLNTMLYSLENDHEIKKRIASQYPAHEDYLEEYFEQINSDIAAQLADYLDHAEIPSRV